MTEELREENTDVIKEADDKEEIEPTQNEQADESEQKQEESDYESIVEADLLALREEFSELGEINSILELKNPIRYGALRDLGLTPAEAYLASEGRMRRKDNRAHLKSSLPRSVSSPASEIPKRELEIARELFSDLSEREIHKLYKKVKG